MDSMPREKKNLLPVYMVQINFVNIQLDSPRLKKTGISENIGLSFVFLLYKNKFFFV